MMLRTLLFAGGLAILSCLGVHAQTAYWVIRPQYSSIETYSDQLFKVKSGDLSGLMDKTGKMVVPVVVDSITDMRNGHALTLKYTKDGKFKLMGILHHDLTYSNVKGDYYMGLYPFYSEDRMPVYNDKDKLGYIDPDGREVVDFNLVEAHPFCEGIASVSKGRKGFAAAVDKAEAALTGNQKNKGTLGYIKNDGKFIVLQKNLGKLKEAYSFRHGEALVVTEDDRRCFINTRGQMIREDNNVLIALDDVYAYNPEFVNVAQKSQGNQVYNGPSTFVEGNLVGYRHKGKVVLLAQFSKAYPFSNNFAIAAVNGKWGVLELLNTDFKHNPKFSVVENSKSQMLDYEIEVPAEWSNATLTMYCTLKNGEQSTCIAQPSGNNKRMFSFSIPAGEKPNIKLEGDNLLIWEKNLGSNTGSAKSGLEIAIMPGVVKANVNNNAGVTIKITNHSSQNQQLTVSVSGEKVTRVNNKSVSILAGESEKVYATYSNVTKEGVYTLTVKLSNGQTTSRKITVKPFFDKL